MTQIEIQKALKAGKIVSFVCITIPGRMRYKLENNQLVFQHAETKHKFVWLESECTLETLCSHEHSRENIRIEEPQ